MNITKLNKQFEDHIKQQLADTADYLYKEIDNILEFYNVEMDCHFEHSLCQTVDRNLNTILKNKLITSIEHYIEQEADLSDLKGYYLEDEDSEDEYFYLPELDEFEYSELKCNFN